MRILATSDLHGNLPDVPPCDLLLVGGDVCPIYDHDLKFQWGWLNADFRYWLKDIAFHAGCKIVGIAGNHDFIFEKEPAKVEALNLPWTYLQDSGTEFEGISIYGLPWVPNLPNWAFHANREQLALRYGAVPKGTDIVLSHGPPFGLGDGLGDFTGPRFGSLHVGAKSASDMLGRVNPKAFINGHIHEGFGQSTHRSQHGKRTNVYNVSFVDEEYVPRYFVNDEGHLEAHIVEIILDDAKDTTDSERQVRGPGPDVRQSSESPEGSDRSQSSMADREDTSVDTLNP